MLVEDVQDIIEEKLMKINKYELAKKYIVYRYRRALVRKQNTTDESILGFIRNEKPQANNKSTILASRQRDYIAGEVSKDLTKRLLLPERIVKAEEEGILHFHDANYFVQPIFNSCFVNLADMLEKGTVINEKMIEKPNSFQMACLITTQIITTVASHQYGEQFIDLMYLGEYLRKSYENLKKEMQEKYKQKATEEILEDRIQEHLKKELKLGIQTIRYLINTSIATNGKSPSVTLFLHVEEQNPYKRENAMIIEEILRQTQEGMKNKDGIKENPVFPKLVYILNESNHLIGGVYDYLTQLAFECSNQTGYPEYMGEKSFLLIREKNGNFNQGMVSINLPQIGIIADENEERFWQELRERLELCKEALMCRHYALLGTKSDISPIHWQYGGIVRLKPGENIDKFLMNGFSTISLGYSGLYEVTKMMTGESHTTLKGHNFARKVMKQLKETISQWKKETNLGFILYNLPEENKGCNFAKIDKERFGTIKDVTDKGYYTNSYYVDKREKMQNMDKLNFESEFQKMTSENSIPYSNTIDKESFCDSIISS